MNRKKFFAAGLAGIASALIKPSALMSRTEEPLPYKIEQVKEFVIAGHGNLQKVKEMLAELPNLLFSSYDWGNGDFEEAIEGAGHVGNKEIAQYLIEQGARPNIFVLTMLGETDVVKAMLNRHPSLLTAKGPHGLTLLHHAQKGGEGAKEIFEFLKEEGLKDMQIKIK